MLFYRYLNVGKSQEMVWIGARCVWEPLVFRQCQAWIIEFKECYKRMEHTTLNTSSRHVTCVLLVTVSMLIVVDPLNKELEILHERSLVEFTSSLSLCRRRILPSPAPSYKWVWRLRRGNNRQFDKTFSTPFTCRILQASPGLIAATRLGHQARSLVKVYDFWNWSEITTCGHVMKVFTGQESQAKWPHATRIHKITVHRVQDI